MVKHEKDHIYPYKCRKCGARNARKLESAVQKKAKAYEILEKLDETQVKEESNEYETLGDCL